MIFRKDSDNSLKSRRAKIKEENETLKELKKNTEFEKGDFAALIIAFLTTVLPVVVVVLILYYVISMFFFG